MIGTKDLQNRSLLAPEFWSCQIKLILVVFYILPARASCHPELFSWLYGMRRRCSRLGGERLSKQVLKCKILSTLCQYEGTTATTNHSTHICRLCCTFNQNWSFTETHICSMIFVLPICIQRGTVFFDVTLKFPMLRWRVDLTGSQLANRRATKVGCAARVIETCSHSCMLYDVYCIHYESQPGG